ncbi:MAG TPA: DUF4838 domain-containing protein, partial [Candidatus Binataceae bacterium]|nr:DUF4838 domain-containing protein [Candidatus Binataceae bacterium]
HDSCVMVRRGNQIVLEARTSRGALSAVYHLLEQLGARFPLGRPAEFPHIALERLISVEPSRIEPVFTRRAFASDIMSWSYTEPDRLELHLEHDREFIPWMAQRGINAFSFIRHAADSQVRIDQLTPLLAERGVGAEYGGHVTQLLLPRERFETHADYFPIGADGARMRRGNLCVSNRAAIALVLANAIKYATDYPENTMLHVWGADVEGGAWCRCGGCARMSPQLQYMKIVNAIAETIAKVAGPPVAYLAYHDTLEPDPHLAPRTNVWFEWAPRERCYSHAIDDSSCETNPRYWESLKRYVEMFEGRGHIFEYYADAILFGGIGFATPAIIARDLGVYHALGLRSISCLTFGAFSVMAYPVNLIAFARGTRDLNFNPDSTLADAAAERHPACAADMAMAYRAIEQASKFVLTYGDVMAPRLSGDARSRKRAELREAVAMMRKAIEAAEHVLESARVPLVAAERELWEYGIETLSGIADYLGDTEGAATMKKLEAALRHIRAIEVEFKGNWGLDLERFHQVWLAGFGKRAAD